jgi:hypothetical protein
MSEREDAEAEIANGSREARMSGWRRATVLPLA